GAAALAGRFGRLLRRAAVAVAVIAAVAAAAAAETAGVPVAAAGGAAGCAALRRGVVGAGGVGGVHAAAAHVGVAVLAAGFGRLLVLGAVPGRAPVGCMIVKAGVIVFVAHTCPSFLCTFGRGFPPSLLKSIPGNCEDRKSTRLNSSHVSISYAVFCLKKKN